ncbi:MAG: TonB-dependent receptor, partial [Rhodothermales bacterium]|nr:TonB-dependent receptor [Rhodothermales bacterium]
VGVPLAEALERLLEETRLSLIYETALITGRTAYCRAERQPAEAVLACILRGTGLDYVRLSSGTYVLVRDARAPPRYASLSGQVLDAATGRPLPDASVLLAGDGVGAATNRDGRFAFAALRPGPHPFVVTHVAYHAAADTIYVGPDEHGRVAIALEPRVVLSAPVVVSAFEVRLPSDALGSGRPGEARAAPAGVGAQDVVQALDAVVGVRLGDALSDVHVQGGASDEQQFLLDGVPVFVPVPNGGFVGPFSPFAAGQVTVRKAGYGAAHSGGLSGVIEVEQTPAPRDGPRLTAQVDPLSLNARWAGRAGAPERVEAVWMVALRKGLWDLYEPHRLEALFQRWAAPDPFLLEALQSPTAAPGDGAVPEAAIGPVEVGFDDVHGAARIGFGGLRSLYVSLYHGANIFGVDDVARPDPQAPGAPATPEEDAFEDAYRWRNRTAQVRYEWVQGRRLFLHAEAWGSGYELVHPVSAERAGAPGATTSQEFNEVAEAGLRLGGDLAASARHTLSGALEAAHTESDFILSLDPLGRAPVGPEAVRPVRWRAAAFAEDRYAVSERATATLGIRLTYLPARSTVFAEPRLAVQYDRPVGPRGVLALRGAVGLYRQYLHAFDVATYNVAALLPRVRFWLPVGRRQRPPEAYHATAAVRYRPAPGWEVGAESYYKHQPHLLVLDYGRLAAEGATPDDVLTGADGYAYGAALSAARTARRLHLGVQYEYAVARRRVANRFDGAFVPVPWDAPHRLYLTLDLRPRPRWTATVRWQGLFGRSWGFRQAYYDFLEPTASAQAFPPFDLSDPAAHRLPVFSQWDAGLAYGRTVAGVGVQARISVINLLDRGNVTDWSLRYDAASGTYRRHERRAAPFIPSAALRLSL